MGRLGPGGAAAGREAEQYARLIAQGYNNSEACRIVGINRRTGKRWRHGRTITTRDGRKLHYSAVVAAADRRVREISDRYLSEQERVRIAFAQDAAGPHRTLTLARYAILVEAGIHPSLRAQLMATGARVNAWFMNWLRIAGSADPGRDAPIIMNHWTGIVLHELAIPDPAFDPYPQIAALVTAVIRSRSAEVQP